MRHTYKQNDTLPCSLGQHAHSHAFVTNVTSYTHTRQDNHSLVHDAHNHSKHAQRKNSNNHVGQENITEKKNSIYLHKTTEGGDFQE